MGGVGCLVGPECMARAVPPRVHGGCWGRNPALPCPCPPPPARPQLESFMSELESSGLLADAPEPDPEQPNHQAPGSQQAAAAAGAPAAGAAAAGGVEEPAAPAAAVAAPCADDGASEQVTLGRLLGDERWCKCLDTGAGSIYYWNVETDEVVWEPPPGLDSEQLVPGSGSAAPPAADGEPADAAAAASADGGAAGAASGVPAHVAGPASGSGGPAGAAGEAGCNGLAAPRDDVEPVFHTLLAELHEVAGPALASLSPAARMAIEAQLRFADWQHWAKRQQAAAAGGEAAAALSWAAYEQRTQQQLRSMFEALQSALTAGVEQQEAAAQQARQAADPAEVRGGAGQLGCCGCARACDGGCRGGEQHGRHASQGRGGLLGLRHAVGEAPVTRLHGPACMAGLSRFAPPPPPPRVLWGCCSRRTLHLPPPSPLARPLL